MIDALSRNPAMDVCDMVRHLYSKGNYAPDNSVGVEAQLFGRTLPMPAMNVGKAILDTQFHGKLDSMNVDVRIRKDTGKIVQGRETNATSGTDQQCVIRTRTLIQLVETAYGSEPASHDYKSRRSRPRPNLHEEHLHVIDLMVARDGIGPLRDVDNT